jgi:hypothetical protein
MKLVHLLLLICITSISHADSLCFSPVKEKSGDKDTKRSFWQAFDYKVQIDDGPIVTPSETESTKYSISSERPFVKIFLGEKVVESFYVETEWIAEGRNCIYFKNIYETWSVVEKWQAKKLCTCE